MESCSVNTKANIGANNGKKLENNQKINISWINKNLNNKKLNYINKKIENIRIIKGTILIIFQNKEKNF